MVIFKMTPSIITENGKIMQSIKKRQGETKLPIKELLTEKKIYFYSRILRIEI